MNEFFSFGNILSMLSIIVSIIFYCISINMFSPLYLMKSTILIPKEFSLLKDISIKYGKKDVNSITSTKIVIWNKGNRTLDKSDMSKNEKLRIEPSESTQILDYQIITQSNNVNEVRLSMKKGVLFVDFEYFDKKQGTIINIIHTGLQENSLSIKGVFKSTGAIRNGKRFEKWLPKEDNIKEYIILFLFLFMMICQQVNMSFYYFFVVNNTPSENIFVNAFFFIKPILPFVYIFIFGLLYFSTFKIPKKLKSFYLDMGDKSLLFGRNI